LPLTNGGGVDDEIESGMTAQTPQWWVPSVVVAAIDELETDVASWTCNNESCVQR